MELHPTDGRSKTPKNRMSKKRRQTKAKEIWDVLSQIEVHPPVREAFVLDLNFYKGGGAFLPLVWIDDFYFLILLLLLCVLLFYSIFLYLPYIPSINVSTDSNICWERGGLEHFSADLIPYFPIKRSKSTEIEWDSLEWSSSHQNHGHGWNILSLTVFHFASWWKNTVIQEF